MIWVAAVAMFVAAFVLTAAITGNWCVFVEIDGRRREAHGRNYRG